MQVLDWKPVSFLFLKEHVFKAAALTFQFLPKLDSSLLARRRSLFFPFSFSEDLRV